MRDRRSRRTLRNRRSLPTLPRSTIAALWRLIPEKIPMLAIAGLFCLVAVHGQASNRDGGNSGDPIRPAGGERADFLRRLRGPVVLSRGPGPLLSTPIRARAWQVVAAALILTGITAAAIQWRRQRPYLLVGWLWYVGMLVPVIGLVQFGPRPRPTASPICRRLDFRSPWFGVWPRAQGRAARHGFRRLSAWPLPPRAA